MHPVSSTVLSFRNCGTTTELPPVSVPESMLVRNPPQRVAVTPGRGPDRPPALADDCPASYAAASGCTGASTLDQHPGFLQRVEDLPVECIVSARVGQIGAPS